MQLPTSLFDLIMHLDVYLGAFTSHYGSLTYAALAGIIFCETGLVVTPFLPGDSLLFAAGATSQTPNSALTPGLLLLILWLAGVCGDSTNYWIGRFIGPRAFHSNSRLLNKKHLERTHQFYERHGASTVIVARFVPIVRTFAPFVAGIGAMRYRRFIIFSVTGNFLWVGLFVLGGYFFGGLEVVKKHFSLVIVVVILISFVPGIVEYLKHRREAKSPKRPTSVDAP
jgi:membrane-associated protein